MQVESSDSEDLTSEESDESTWIQWYCGLKGKEFFCEVDEEFIQDDFNLIGLRSIVPNYDYALDLILDCETEGLTEEQQEIVETAAEYLYGLIHARFILTHRGMMAMLEKYQRVDFGRCPRVLCGGQPVLPAGQSDISRTNNMKIFCPKCEDLYYPRYRRHSNIDGAYFGTTFCHLFLQTHPGLRPEPAVEKYVPRIYGFKVHPSAREREEEERRKIQNRNATIARGRQTRPPAIAAAVPDAKKGRR